LIEARTERRIGTVVFGRSFRPSSKELPMNRPLPPTFGSLFPAAFFAVCAISSGATATATDRVVAFPDRYEFRNAGYRQLGPLEAAVRATWLKALHIDICGPGSARAFKAAAHRFSDLELSVAVQQDGSQMCRAPIAAMPVTTSTPLSDIDDGEVERYWQRTMP
jgi:hypothetical protein